MLELMKLLLGVDVSDTFLDPVYNHFILKAHNAVKNYCNIDVIGYDLNPSIVDLAIFYLKNKDIEGYSQSTQGGRSVSVSCDIPDTIKITLPLPKIKVVE